MQYLYNDGELYYFMDNDTFDQIPLHHDQVEEALKYLRENDEATIKFYKGAPFLVEAPQFRRSGYHRYRARFRRQHSTGRAEACYC